MEVTVMIERISHPRKALMLYRIYLIPAYCLVVENSLLSRNSLFFDICWIRVIRFQCSNDPAFKFFSSRDLHLFRKSSVIFVPLKILRSIFKHSLKRSYFRLSLHQLILMVTAKTARRSFKCFTKGLLTKN